MERREFARNLRRRPTRAKGRSLGTPARLALSRRKVPPSSSVRPVCRRLLLSRRQTRRRIGRQAARVVFGLRRRTHGGFGTARRAGDPLHERRSLRRSRFGAGLDLRGTALAFRPTLGPLTPAPLPAGRGVRAAEAIARNPRLIPPAP